MSGCPEFEEAIALHAAGDLDAVTRDLLERHLAACPACAGELAETRALLAELRADAPPLAAAREATFAARARARAERSAAVPPPARRTRAVRTLAATGALAAAAALAFALRSAPATPPAPGPAAATVADPEEALAAELAALAAADADAADLVPEPDAGFGLDGLTDEELEAMETLLASTGG